MKYWAFLSYSHTDKKWADWLHKALETYRVPRRVVGKESRDGKIPERLFPIFRDREELPVSADLGSNINEALRESRYLIVICSPRAAQSRWVGEEIKTFKKLGREDRILALIIDGEPNASDGKPGFRPEDECFHEAMRYRMVDGEPTKVRSEPIAADAREGKDKKTNAKLKLLAGLLSVNYDDLKQREQERRLKRARKLTLSGLLLVGIFIALSIALFVQKRESTRAHAEEAKQRVLAKEQSQRRLAEAAHFDLTTARERFQVGESPAAFAYLARSLLNDNTSTSAAAEAVAALNVWIYPTPIALCEHGDQVVSAQFSPNGRFLVTASNDKTARIWETESGKLIATLQGHEGQLCSAQWSPDSKRVVTASVDKTARVWNAQDGKLLGTLTGHSDSLRLAQFSLDGQQILTASNDKTVRVWDANRANLIISIPAHKQGIHDAQLSPDGQRVVTASEDKTARIWNARNGNLIATLQGHRGAVLGAKFSSEGQRILTASWDGTARVWDAQNGKLLATLEGHRGVVRNAQFSPNGELVVTASHDHTARTWDWKTGKVLATFEGHRDELVSAQFGPDAHRVLTCSSDGTARVWDAESGALLAILQGHRGPVQCAQFSRDGSRVVTASDRFGRVWPADNSKLIVTLREPKNLVKNLKLSRDGQRFVMTSLSAGIHDVAQIWDFQNAQPIATLQEDGETKTGVGTSMGAPAEKMLHIVSTQFNPSGDLVVTGSQGGTLRIWNAKTPLIISTRAAAQIWNAKTGMLIRTLEGHSGSVTSAEFSMNSDRLVTTSLDRTARVWDVQSGKVLLVLDHPSAVSCAQFSPDGKRVATAARDKTVRVWNAQNGQLLRSCEGHADLIHSIRFSPDGGRLLTASDDRTARLWDAPSGKPIAILTGHQAAVVSANFCFNGEGVVTASYDQTARIWEARTGELLATLRTNWDKPAGAPETAAQAQASSLFSSGRSRVSSSTDKSGHRVLNGDIGEVLTAQFGPDCDTVVTGSIVGAFYKWTILPPNAQPPPAWFTDFLQYMAQLRLNANGELEAVPVHEWLALHARLREALRQSAGHETPYSRILRRFVRE